jgi:hypothetical protein
MLWRANPDEETTDWRAVCGRTACTVRRAGRARALSDPYAKRSSSRLNLSSNRLRVFRIANTVRLGRGVGQERW